MRRVDLTVEQLEDVIRHRQGGLSWLRIQETTGISRRVAQRSYEQWQRARSIRELENVRVKVGEIEFEGHLDVLERLAQALVEHLSLPEYPGFSTNAETYFSRLMEKDIAEPPAKDKAGLPAEAAPPTGEARTIRRNIRRNRLLFESLKEHTADRIRWDSLDDWMEGWDTCYRIYPGLVTVAEEVIRTTFSRFPGLDELFIPERGQDALLEILDEGVRDILWRGIVGGVVTGATDLIRSERVELKGEEVFRITIGVRTLFSRDNSEIEPSIVGCCREIVDELWNTGEVKEINRTVKQMGDVVAELEAVLERLVLRPLILRTRCKICPA